MSDTPQNQNEAIALHQEVYEQLPDYTHDLNAIVAACEAKDLAVTIVRTPWLTTKWAADLEEVDKRESGEIDRDTPAQALADAYCELFGLTWEKAK